MFGLLNLYFILSNMQPACVGLCYTHYSCVGEVAAEQGSLF